MGGGGFLGYFPLQLSTLKAPLPLKPLGGEWITKGLHTGQRRDSALISIRGVIEKSLGCFGDWEDREGTCPSFALCFDPLKSTAPHGIWRLGNEIRESVLRGNRVGRPSPTPVGSPKSNEIDPVALAVEHLLSGFYQRLSGAVVRCDLAC